MPRACSSAPPQLPVMGCCRPIPSWCIRRDLDWMNRMGIGGVDAIDASIDTPQVVKKRLVYMTPEWKGAFHTAADLTARYGMELSIDSSPGWSETGGPWVSPQAAMKKL